MSRLRNILIVDSTIHNLYYTPHSNKYYKGLFIAFKGTNYYGAG